VRLDGAIANDNTQVSKHFRDGIVAKGWIMCSTCAWPFARCIAESHFHVRRRWEFGTLWKARSLSRSPLESQVVNWSKMRARCMFEMSRDVERWRCGARLRRSLPYKYFLNADALRDISCTGLAKASIIGFQIIRRPVLHAGGAHAYARLSQFYSMTRE